MIATPASRRDFLRRTTAAAAWWAARPLTAADTPPFVFQPEDPVIAAPDDPRDWPEFRRQLAAWKTARRQALRYDDALYRRPEFAWTRRTFACAFLMLCDEAFYDPARARYRVPEWLEAGRQEFGAFDAVVLWHAYPRLGLDARNQFDFYRDLPGGLPGLRAAVDEFHTHDTRVFLDYNPWDTGTRREPTSDLDALCECVRALDADGLFLDTMDRGAAEFRARLDAARPGVALESEIALPLERVHDHHLSWAQWFGDRRVPGVLRNKWYEPRHLQHQIRRWDADHSEEIHAAWMNGSGMLVWENVFGSWCGWSARDRSLLRALLPIQRRYAALFTDGAWTPLALDDTPETTVGPGSAPERTVFGSLWERDGVRLWTVVNRAEQPAEFEVPWRAAPGERAFDLIGGREIRRDSALCGASCIRLPIGARGLGALLFGPEESVDADLLEFLRRQAALHAHAQDDATTPVRTTRLRPVAPTRPHATPPAGMAEVPATTLTLRIELRTRECGFYEGTADRPRLARSDQKVLATFERTARIGRVAMDLTPVTNAQFAEFLRAAAYRPAHPEQFLRHWVHGAPPPSKADHPVVYVDLDDARAYAAWAGKRLPTEEEWQFAAQGTDGRRYPWGDRLETGRCNRGETGDTTPVTAFPDGRSPFGLLDLCGNVWQWTESEHSDGHTRFALLRGGSFYQAHGSIWYFDGGPRPANYAAKMLLMWPGLDRCATVGFRCVVDLA